MKETKVYCDHCGKEINLFAGYDNLEIDLNHISVETDLCSKCFDELYAVIKSYCKKGGEADA